MSASPIADRSRSKKQTEAGYLDTTITIVKRSEKFHPAIKTAVSTFAYTWL